MSYSIVGTYPHDTSSYTQGLIIYNGNMYEGTGNYGHSKLKQVDLMTGKANLEISLDKKYFGEGITILNDTVYQLTYKEKTVFKYTLKDFKKIKEFTVDFEGWGLTNDGKNLIVSTGSSELNYYEPSTFKLLKTQTVTESGMPVSNINELEYINGEVWANIWQTFRIARISPQTGQVLGWIDFSGILKESADIDVMNGIAYDAKRDRLFVTGKLWPKIFEVKIVPR